PDSLALDAVRCPLRCRARSTTIPMAAEVLGGWCMRVIGGALLGLVLMVGAAGDGRAAGNGADACTDLAELRDARLRLQVTGTEQVPAAAPGTVRAQPYLPPIAVALPAYCKVSGRLDDRIGAGGTRYGIGFELA